MTGPTGARGAPRREILQGRWARLEPLDAARHGPALWRGVVGHDELWTYLGYGPFANEQVFVDWLAGRTDAVDPLVFVVLDARGGEAKGVVTFMRVDVPNGCVETGHIFFAPALQRTPAATEAIYLQARHVFEDLGYRRFEWKCDDGNRPSKRAALRLGFTFEGVFRQHLIVKGRNRDTAWFSMLDGEWPRRKASFERWLDPSNFDAEGRQKTSLSALNGVEGA
jgi:RimJ/RimL family protein N-acetyltransferase